MQKKDANSTKTREKGGDTTKRTQLKRQGVQNLRDRGKTKREREREREGEGEEAGERH